MSGGKLARAAHHGRQLALRLRGLALAGLGQGRGILVGVEIWHVLGPPYRRERRRAVGGLSVETSLNRLRRRA
jgi:hypothetical protein